jgi:hypothetical protein
MQTQTTSSKQQRYSNAQTWHVQVTDTFGGQANYCWVRNYTITTYGKTTQYNVVRAAKRAAGWQGLRCNVANYGDSYTITPCGRNAPCWVMFVQ